MRMHTQKASYLLLLTLECQIFSLSPHSSYSPSPLPPPPPVSQPTSRQICASWTEKTSATKQSKTCIRGLVRFLAHLRLSLGDRQSRINTDPAAANSTSSEDNDITANPEHSLAIEDIVQVTAERSRQSVGRPPPVRTSQWAPFIPETGDPRLTSGCH